MKYKIGENYFRTQEEAKQYVRNVIKSINLNDAEIDSNNPKFIIIHDIVKCHRYYESKKGCGIKSFFTTYNSLTKCKELNIRRTDESVIDISYIVCAQDSIIDKNKLKVHSINFKLYEAMRVAIQNQIMRYRNNNRGILEKCAICEISNSNSGFPSGFVEFHVDHKQPSFRYLRDEFLNNKRNQGLYIPSNFSENEHNATIFRAQDAEFSDEWSEYHKQNATYQILCKLCNLRKKKD